MRQFRTIETLIYDDDATIKLKVVNAPTIRIPAVRRACDGYPFDSDCGAPVERDGLCALHYYKLASFLKWQAMWKEYAS
jgi:hypothetical protein